MSQHMRFVHDHYELRLSWWWQSLAMGYFYKTPEGWLYEVRIDGHTKAYGSAQPFATLSDALAAARIRYKSERG